MSYFEGFADVVVFDSALTPRQCRAAMYLMSKQCGKGIRWHHRVRAWMMRRGI